ncbi:hypothetical protein, partial [Megalodesulfovibrio gigas]
VDGVLVAGRMTSDLAHAVTAQELVQLGGPWAAMDVKVSAVTANYQVGAAAVLTVTTPPPPAPTGLAVAGVLTAGVVLAWNAAAGATGYIVLQGSLDGFAPEDGTQAYAGTVPSAVAPMNVTPPYLRYVRVAATDAATRELVDLTWSDAVAIVDATNGLVTHTGALIITDAGAPLAIA